MKLQSLANADCQACAAVTDRVQNVYVDGGFKNGGDWSVLASSAIPLQPPDKPIINVAIRITAGVYKESSTTDPQPIDRTISRFNFHLLWTQQAWYIHRLESG